jgi:superfamily II helicase
MDDFEKQFPEVDRQRHHSLYIEAQLIWVSCHVEILRREILRTAPSGLPRTAYHAQILQETRQNVDRTLAMLSDHDPRHVSQLAFLLNATQNRQP